MIEHGGNYSKANIDGSEQEPKSITTFVYRGENPFMKGLVESVKLQGEHVRVNEINPAIYETASNSDPAYIAQRQNLYGDLSGIVVTDMTLYKEISLILKESGKKPINAYHALESVRMAESLGTDYPTTRLSDMVRPVVEELRQDGKTPIVLNDNLDDHIGSVEFNLEEAEDFLEEVVGSYAGAIKRDLDVEIRDETTSEENVVYLADHHRVRDTKGNGEKVVLICPCCIGTPGRYGEMIIKAGYQLYPLSYSVQREEAVQNLLQMIKEERTKDTVL